MKIVDSFDFTRTNVQYNGICNVVFPVVRKVFAGLISNEIVSVQPMSLPSGLLFYLDYTYGNNKDDMSFYRESYQNKDQSDDGYIYLTRNTEENETINSK